MRRSLSLILVMLLVLRGLLGDAMAMGTAPVASLGAPAHHFTSVAAERPMTTPHQDHVGANEHVTVIVSTAGEASSAPDCGHTSGPTCSACGICHSALFIPYPLVQSLSHQPCALHPLSSTPFASAPAALAIKPPIS